MCMYSGEVFMWAVTRSWLLVSLSCRNIANVATSQRPSDGWLVLPIMRRKQRPFSTRQARSNDGTTCIMDMAASCLVKGGVVLRCPTLLRLLNRSLAIAEKLRATSHSIHGWNVPARKPQTLSALQHCRIDYAKLRTDFLLVFLLWLRIVFNRQRMLNLVHRVHIYLMLKRVNI